MVAIEGGDYLNGFGIIGEVDNGVIYKRGGLSRSPVAQVVDDSVVTIPGRRPIGRLAYRDGCDKCAVSRVGPGGSRIVGYANAGAIKKGEARPGTRRWDDGTGTTTTRCRGAGRRLPVWHWGCSMIRR